MSETQTVTLTGFLLARIAEDEAVAFGGAPSPWSKGKWDGEFEGAREVLDRFGEVTAQAFYGGTYGHVLRFDPTRILRECEAKRRIVEWMSDEVEHVVYGDDVLRALASVYADHPDYRDEWRP